MAEHLFMIFRRFTMGKQDCQNRIERVKIKDVNTHIFRNKVVLLSPLLLLLLLKSVTLFHYLYSDRFAITSSFPVLTEVFISLEPHFLPASLV